LHRFCFDDAHYFSLRIMVRYFFDDFKISIDLLLLPYRILLLLNMIVHLATKYGYTSHFEAIS
jgi:hypothetical protein